MISVAISERPSILAALPFGFFTSSVKLTVSTPVFNRKYRRSLHTKQRRGLLTMHDIPAWSWPYLKAAVS